MSSDPNSLLPPVRYRTEFEKSVLISNFEGRSFKRTDSERDWNFLWATVGTIRSMFQTDSNGGYRLNDDQIVNHFPNHYELTRKDLMVKNLKRYRLKLERDGSELAEKSGGGGGNYKHLDFFPATYSMPSEGHLLLDEFKRNLNHIWIAKPNGKSQGKGVFMIHKMNQLKKFLNKLSPNGNSNTMTASMTTTSSTSSAAGASSSSSASSSTPNVGPTERIRDSYVISRYIENPLLIGGKKFDLRLYCLVTNYRPLKVYLYKEGFARFCNVKYSSSLSDLDNPFIHLTNVAIQKHGDDYNMKHGNKWSLRNLRIFLEGTRGSEETQRMFEAITFIMIHSLKSVKDVIQNDKHCFECYGFDLLIDENLKPWLLEVSYIFRNNNKDGGRERKDRYSNRKSRHPTIHYPSLTLLLSLSLLSALSLVRVVGECLPFSLDHHQTGSCLKNEIDRRSSRSCRTTGLSFNNNLTWYNKLEYKVGRRKF